MANIGYTLMTEQAGPQDLVRWAVRAEETGFDLLVSSDHYFPCQEMLAEAVCIIRDLLDGGYVNFKGTHFRVDAARIWDLPDRSVPLGVAVSGQQSCELFAPLADVMIAVEPDGSLAGWWDAASGTGRPARKIGQMPICWGPDRDERIRRAHEQFRWFGGGWKVNAELPGTTGFAGATSFVRPEDVADSIPCGDSVDAVAEAAEAFFKLPAPTRTAPPVTDCPQDGKSVSAEAAVAGPATTPKAVFADAEGAQRSCSGGDVAT
jgi:alkanesulfonate monooxygenase SsuD/methylene tetrahydromethanopterin reductase-like flavin-dependent oxidoreductase (luciferase family)